MSAPHARLWVPALAASLGIHGALAAGLVMLPAPESRRVEAFVDVLTVPGGAALAPAVTVGPDVAAVAPASPAPQAVPSPANEVSPVAAVPAEAAPVVVASDSAVTAVQPQASPVAASPATQAAAPASQPQASAVAVPSTAPAVAPSPAIVESPVVDAAVHTDTAAPSPLGDTAPTPAAASSPRTTSSSAASAATAPVVPERPSAAATVPATGSAAHAPRGDTVSVPVAAPSPRTASSSVASAATAPAAANVPVTGSAAPAQRGGTASAPVAAAPRAASSSAAAAAPAAASRPLAASAPVANAPMPRTAPAAVAPSAAVGAAPRATDMALLMPGQPARPAPPRQETDPREKVLELLDAYEGTECFLAMASAPQGAALSVDGMGAAGDVARLGEELARLAGVRVETRAHPVTPEQCAALAFTRAVSPEPGRRLDIRLDDRSVASGATVSGDITNLDRLWLFLLVVDDEGKVQKIDNLFRHERGTIGFSAPVTLTGGPVATAHLLLAVAADHPLDTFTSHDGEHAAAYFAALAEEVARKHAHVDLGFASFFLR